MQTTELEKIERAKTYMDKLANGMNPLDDSMVPEAELINNVHLSRYFFFIPDALRQVIAKGGTLAPVNAKKIKKVPLEILFEKESNLYILIAQFPEARLPDGSTNWKSGEYAKAYLYRYHRLANSNRSDGENLCVQQNG